MHFLKVSISVSHEGIEALTAILYDLGITSIEIIDAQEIKQLIENSTGWDYFDASLLSDDVGAEVSLYLNNDPTTAETLKSITAAVDELKTTVLDFDTGTLEICTQIVNDEDWANNWKKYYKPFPVGEKVLIKPAWENISDADGRIVFNINPGSVFGTGMHQSTQLCIQLLENYLQPNNTVLDLGCGSGILSIISLLLGADNAIAVDIDSNATANAYENLSLNNLPKHRYNVLCGNVATDKTLQDEIGYGKYNVVLANIVADVIISLLDCIKLQLAPNGYLICSGIIKERLTDVETSLQAHGFTITETIFKDDWVALSAKKDL